MTVFRVVASWVLLVGLACAGPEPTTVTGSFDRDVLEGGVAGERALARLAADFYGRLENRRFNSIATYQDPALREYFQTIESYSDYYADLAQVLTDGHFEANRPTSVEVIDIKTDGPDSAVVVVRFVGENGRPLRWWKTGLERSDQWKRESDRWWIIPGKL